MLISHMMLYTGWQCVYCMYLSLILRGHFEAPNFACRLSAM